MAYRERNPDVPVVSRLDERICELLDRGGASVEDTTGSIPSLVHAPREIAGVEIRTREGWAVHLAGEAGADLERKLGTGIAGAMIYMASVGDCPLLGTSDAVIQDLRRSARGPGCDFEHDLI